MACEWFGDFTVMSRCDPGRLDSGTLLLVLPKVFFSSWNFAKLGQNFLGNFGGNCLGTRGDVCDWNFANWLCILTKISGSKGEFRQSCNQLIFG